jgi:hypothetical protein
MVVIPDIEDATSLYRSSGPLCELRRNMDLNLIFMDKLGENKLEFADAVFMQRPAGANHLQLAQMCKDNGVPLWVDYDDLLFDIPKDNPAHLSYMNPEIRKSVVKIIQMATVVTVSTEQLKRCFQPKGASLNDRIFVINNAIPRRFMNLAKPYQYKKHVNWRGSNTHQKDLAEFANEIVELSEERKDTTFTFVGYNPWFITQYMDPQRAIVAPPMSIGDYFRFMVATNPSVQIVPLDSSMFNLCKSNIAWLEGCLAGAVTVAPAWPEWSKKPGVLNYKSTEEFKMRIAQALDEPTEMAKQHAASWEHINAHYFLPTVNKKREEIVNALFDMARSGIDTFPDGGKAADNEEGMALE